MSKKLIALVLTTGILLVGGCKSTPNLEKANEPKTVTTNEANKDEQNNKELKKVVTDDLQVEESLTTTIKENTSTKSISTEKVSTTITEKASTSNSASKSQVTVKQPVNDAKATTTTQVVNKLGNSSGNISNDGYAAKQGEWIYYVHISDNPSYSEYAGLYKMKEDGSNKTKLSSGYFRNINVIGEWIYYHDMISTGLYKMKTNGTSKMLVRDGYVQNVNVIGSKIYFTAIDGLYKMNTDGSETVKLVDGNIKEITINGNYIYYINGDEFRIYKMKLDGSENQKVTDKRAYYMRQIGNYIFFTMPLESELPKAGNNMLYRINIDGTGLIKIDDRNIHNFNVDEQFLYVYGLDYVKGDGIPATYKMKFDGSNKIKISSKGGIQSLTILGNWIYYKDFTSRDINDRLCRMKIDGTSDQVIK